MCTLPRATVTKLFSWKYFLFWENCWGCEPWETAGFWDSWHRSLLYFILCTSYMARRTGYGSWLWYKCIVIVRSKNRSGPESTSSIVQQFFLLEGNLLNWRWPSSSSVAGVRILGKCILGYNTCNKWGSARTMISELLRSSALQITGIF